MGKATDAARETADTAGAPVRVGRFALGLLRGFELRADGRVLTVPLSAQRVVAFLGLHPGRRARIYVAGLLWIDASEQRAAAALRTALWRLGLLGAGLVRCDGQSLCLEPDVEVDIARCSQLARTVLDGASGTLNRSELGALRDGGDLLTDWYDDWVLIERERFRQLRLHALERLCSELSAAGRHADATEAGLAAVASDPLRESAHRVLIEAHLAEGNAGDALRQYEVCCHRLRRELDLEPSALLAALIAPVQRRGVTAP